VLPKKFIAFHWHGDIFDIPPQALRTAESDGCTNQAFILAKAVGLQSYLELSMDKHRPFDQELQRQTGRWEIHTKSKRATIPSRQVPGINRLMALFLDNMAKELG
jgi:hypothetical protein